jgi:hypothetical protein
VATQVYEEKPSGFAGDSGGAWDTYRYHPGTYDATVKSLFQIVWVGFGAKQENAQAAFQKHYLQIPIGSSIIKVKATTKTRGAPDTPPHNGSFIEPPLLKLGFLAHDGLWDREPPTPGSGITGVQDEVHWISQVLDTNSSEVWKTSLIMHGPEFALTPWAKQSSVGMKFKVPWPGSTLGSILARMARDDGATSADLVMKVYSPVSASDPRPGALLATSDPVPFSSVPLDYGTQAPPTGWVVFPFSGADRIPLPSGSEFVYLVEYDPVPGSAPWLYWANDDDRNKYPSPNKVGNLPWADVWAVFNDPTFGFHRNFYYNDDLFPTALFPGIPFTDPFYPGTAPIPNGYLNVWGDAAYSPDVELPLASMVQTFIDHASYDESGTMLGIYVETADPDDGKEFGYESWYNPTSDGMLLTIEYAEPEPGKATSPDPAHLETGVPMDKRLSWIVGTYDGTGAVTHDVYFGVDPDPSGNPQGNQAGTTYKPPGDLVPGETYYWRIDEVGEFEVTEGDVWEFTVVEPGPPSYVRGQAFAAPRVSAVSSATPVVSGRGWLVIPVTTGALEPAPSVRGEAKIVQRVVAGDAALVPRVAGKGKLVVLAAAGESSPRVRGHAALQDRVSGEVGVVPLVVGEATLEPRVSGRAGVLDDVR